MPGKAVSYVGTGGKKYAAPPHISVIWRVGVDGASPSRIYTQNAYGLGPLSLLAGGLQVFSSVDNATSASKQYLVAGSLAPPLGGHTRIMRLDPSSGKCRRGPDWRREAGRAAVTPDHAPLCREHQPHSC
ncbi:MAG TPA: hypothetical protein VNL35_02095 [Chloroflexota bacterium]|nr:hypothetical protein [Chloroflexota bacterium]